MPVPAEIPVASNGPLFSTSLAQLLNVKGLEQMIESFQLLLHIRVAPGGGDTAKFAAGQTALLTVAAGEMDQKGEMEFH